MLELAIFVRVTVGVLGLRYKSSLSDTFQHVILRVKTNRCHEKMYNYKSDGKKM